MFKDIDSNLVQLIDNVKFANLEVSDNIYNHEYVQNYCNYTSLHSFSKLLKQNKSEFDLKNASVIDDIVHNLYYYNSE